MDSERIAKVDALFEQALDLPEAERAAYLSRMTDEELRREVSELLRFAVPGEDPGGDEPLDRLGRWVRHLAAAEATPVRRVAGGLDAVPAKALARQPERRRRLGCHVVAAAMAILAAAISTGLVAFLEIAATDPGASRRPHPQEVARPDGSRPAPDTARPGP